MSTEYHCDNNLFHRDLFVTVKTRNPLTGLVQVKSNGLMANPTLAVTGLPILIGANQSVIFMVDLATKTRRLPAIGRWLHVQILM